MRPTRTTTIICALLVLVAARCLRIGFWQAHHLPSYHLRYALAVHGIFVAAFACIVAALLIRNVELPRPLPTLPPKLVPIWRFVVTYVPYLVVGIVVFQKLYDHYGVPYIGTDGALFSRYACDLIFAGKNPYVESMRPAFAAYQFDAPFSTYRIDGTTVEQVSYPAMSFLPFVPQALLHSHSIDATSLVVLAITFFWLIAKADGILRWAPPLLLFLHSDLVNFTAGGVFDILWVLPVLITMQEWSRGRLFTAGLAYGLACSVKQTPWFIGPFLLVALALEQPTRKRFGAFIGGAVATFALTNLPFAVSAPRAWLTGVLTPVAGGVPLVELGEGPILYNIIGATHEPKVFFTLLMAVAFAVCLAGYAIYYPRTKWLAWIAPMVILWFNYRSLHNYYLFSLPLALFAVALRGEEPLPVAAPPKRPWLMPALVTAALAVVAIAAIVLPKRASLGANVSLLASEDPDDLGRASRLRVRVHNDGADAIEPIFLITHAEHQTPFFWRIDDGPPTLGAGADGDYVLTAPAVQATIPLGASMHLHVFNRGQSPWASLLVAPAAGEKPPRPVLRNTSFHDLIQRSESGLYLPVEWGTVPKRPPDWAHFIAKADGMHLTTAARDAAANNDEIALAQTLRALPTSIVIDATPLTVRGGGDVDETPGIEIRDDKKCIIVHFADVTSAATHDSRIRRHDCRVVDLPARAGERATTTLTFADFVDPAFLAAMKGSVRFLLFAGVSHSDNAVIFHRVSSPTTYQDK